MAQTEGLSERAAAVLTQFPGPVILHQTKLIWIVWPVLALILIVYLFMKIWTANLATKEVLLLGAPLAILWGLFAIAAAICIKKDLPRMVLDAEGFELQNLLGAYQKRWRDVAGFSPFPLFVLVCHPTPARGFWKKLNRELWLPAYFGFGTKGLARLMTAWRERALSQPWGR